MVGEAVKMHNIQSSQLLKKTLQRDDIAGQITACLRRLNEGTDRYRVSQAFVALQTSSEHVELAGNDYGYQPSRTAEFAASTGMQGYFRTCSVAEMPVLGLYAFVQRSSGTV